MKVIWKYTIAGIAPRGVIEMPAMAEILHLGVQRGVPTIWAKVDPQNPIVKRHFSVVGTGHPLSGDAAIAEYIGTIQLGDLVWHFFDGGDSA